MVRTYKTYDFKVSIKVNSFWSMEEILYYLKKAIKERLRFKRVKVIRL